MIHGRWDYIRNCKVVKYSFYKSMTFALTQFWYSFYNGFSAQTLYDGWSIAIFNVFFTGLPVIFLGIFDQVCVPS
jgi:magnesium-transporting ATPase (P-type)